MEVNDESDIHDIHLTQVVTNKPVKKGKSKKRIVVDRRKELNLMREPCPQIFTKVSHRNFLSVFLRSSFNNTRLFI